MDSPDSLLDSLNDDTLWEISERLSYPDYLAFIRTCKRLYKLKNIRRKVRYLEEMNEKLRLIKDMELSEFIARRGHLDAIKYLHENSFVFTKKAMDCAASKGHLHIIKWLHENRPEGCTKYAMNYAAEFGYLGILKWLYENRTEGCSRYAITQSHKNNHREVVQFLHEKYGFEIPQ